MRFSKLKSRKIPRHQKNQRRGVAAVEFAMVAPLLLTLIFLMIESSRYLTAIHATTGAAREVARQASVAGLDDAEALSLAQKFMRDSKFNSSRVAVTIESEELEEVPGLRFFEATVTIPFADVSVVGDPFNLDVTEVQGHSAMFMPE